MRLAVLILLGVSALRASDEDAIRKVLADQVEAWNRGDVRAFMTGYDRSPETTFVSDRVTHGWDAVLRRYLARYGSPEKMGTLRFSELEVRQLGTDCAMAVGRWALTRTAEAGGDVGGLFSLVFARRAAGWKIVLDHTHQGASRV